MNSTDPQIRADILDPARFAQNVLRHSIWSKQAEILRAVRDHPLVAVKSCHASGKTFSIAEIVLWWMGTVHGATRIIRRKSARRAG